MARKGAIRVATSKMPKRAANALPLATVKRVAEEQLQDAGETVAAVSADVAPLLAECVDGGSHGGACACACVGSHVRVGAAAAASGFRVFAHAVYRSAGPC